MAVETPAPVLALVAGEPVEAALDGLFRLDRSAFAAHELGFRLSLSARKRHRGLGDAERRADPRTAVGLEGSDGSGIINPLPGPMGKEDSGVAVASAPFGSRETTAVRESESW